MNDDDATAAAVAVAAGSKEVDDDDVDRSVYSMDQTLVATCCDGYLPSASFTCIELHLTRLNSTVVNGSTTKHNS